MVRVSLFSASLALALAGAQANAATTVDVDVNAVPLGTSGSTIGHSLLCDFNGTECTRVTGGTVFAGDVPRTAVMGNGTGFLNIGRGQMAVFNLVGLGWQNFSFDLGTPDTFTTVVLNFLSGGSTTLTTSQIFGTPFPANRSIQRIALSASEVITSVSIGSTGTSTEVDNVMGSVPEPGTWLLMILGLGAVGFAMRRQQKAQVRMQFA